MHEYYGNFRNRKFSDLWEDASSFVANYKASGLYTNDNKISDANATALFYLLYSEYGNSVIASNDENQFTYQIFTTIFEYGPTWERRLKLQTDLRALTNDDITSGSKAIYNHAYHDETAPTTNTTEEMSYISEQNVTKYKKATLEGYALLEELLKTDVTREFISKFKRFFLQIVLPEKPLYYISDAEEEEI